MSPLPHHLPRNSPSGAVGIGKGQWREYLISEPSINDAPFAGGDVLKHIQEFSTIAINFSTYNATSESSYKFDAQLEVLLFFLLMSYAVWLMTMVHQTISYVNRQKTDKLRCSVMMKDDRAVIEWRLHHVSPEEKTRRSHSHEFWYLSGRVERWLLAYLTTRLLWAIHCVVYDNKLPLKHRTSEVESPWLEKRY